MMTSGEKQGAGLQAITFRELARVQIVTCPNHDGSSDQKANTEPYCAFGLRSRLRPFAQCESPQRGENDDARHVQGPAGECVVTHLAFAHCVKEELKIPSSAAKRRKKVVT